MRKYRIEFTNGGGKIVEALNYATEGEFVDFYGPDGSTVSRVRASHIFVIDLVG